MKKTLLFLLIILVIVALILRIRYGGGGPYVDLTGTPLVTGESLEVVLEYGKPIGTVAVSRSGRVFFTVHPESRPIGNKLLEYVDGASVPFPGVRQLAELFHTPLGIVIDLFDRLWTIDEDAEQPEPWRYPIE